MNCKYVLINPTNYKACNIIFTDSVIAVMYFYIVVWLFVCLFVGNKIVCLNYVPNCMELKNL